MNVAQLPFSVVAHDGVAHVCMTHKMPEHDTEAVDCWCHPAVSVLCSECEGNGSDCWKCGGEHWNHVSASDAPFSGDPTLVIHNEFAKR